MARGVKTWREFYAGGAIVRIARARFEPLNEQLAAALIEGTAGDEELEATR